jgi:glyceraldehyde-3-phosphate dehydrogenase/erythrose-4-phosphate dehydrogenase
MTRVAINAFGRIGRTFLRDVMVVLGVSDDNEWAYSCRLVGLVEGVATAR